MILPKILKIIHESNVIVPRIQFVAEPKFSLPLPPPERACSNREKKTSSGSSQKDQGF